MQRQADKVFTDAERDAIEAALEALVSTSMFDHEAAALATLRRLDRDGWQLVQVGLGVEPSEHTPADALAIFDALCGHVRRTAMAEARESFAESLRAHGGRLDEDDVRSVLDGLEA